MVMVSFSMTQNWTCAVGKAVSNNERCMNPHLQSCSLLCQRAELAVQMTPRPVRDASVSVQGALLAAVTLVEGSNEPAAAFAPAASLALQNASAVQADIRGAALKLALFSAGAQQGGHACLLQIPSSDHCRTWP